MTRCVLNTGPGDWAFAPHAERMSRAPGVPVRSTPAGLNYVLALDEDDVPGFYAAHRSFVPLALVELAGDKRPLAAAMIAANVPTPTTRLLDATDEVREFVATNRDRQWCVKYPTSCGGAGHHRIADGWTPRGDWPTPFVVQEFVELDRPEVWRTYAAGGEIVGWNVRRFAAGVKPSPWVAHARGAHYEVFDAPPSEVDVLARHAFDALGALDSFAAIDLLRRPNGEWLVLEIGTDGLFNHVDRELGDSRAEAEIDSAIARAFDAWCRRESSAGD